MNAYTFTIEFKPNWIYGIPHEDKLIVPGGTEVLTHAIEVGTFRKVRHGTLPIYRKDEDKISITKESNGMIIECTDNFMTIKLDGINPKIVLSSIIEYLDKYVFVLSLLNGFRFTYEIISGYDQNSNTVGIPVRIKGYFALYNLDQLNHRINETLNIIPYIDLELKKALEYYDHALFLNDIRNSRTISESKEHYYLLADIILSLHKSISVFLGDPSISRDYQRRYKKYGIDYKFWKEKIEKLREIRNDWDVAHYYPTDERLKELNKHIGDAFDTTKQSFSKYIDYKKNKKHKPSHEKDH